MTTAAKQKKRTEDASHQAAHLWQSESRNASDAGSPRSAIDLPLKILVWEDAGGKVRVSYNSAAYLQERHGLTPDLIKNIAVVEALAAEAAE